MAHVASLEGMDAVDHRRDAPGQQAGHPDGDANDENDHQERRTPQAEGSGAQAVADMLEQGGTLRLEAGILFGNQRVDARGCLGGCLVEVVYVGADGDEAEALRRLAILAGVVGDGGRGGQLPQAGEENDKGAGAAMFGDGIPAIALRREIQVAAIQADGAGLDQFLGRFALQVLVAEGRDAGQEFIGRFAAGL